MVNCYIMESLASKLKDSLMVLVDNINKNPERVMNLGKIVAKSKFDRSLMEAVIIGLSEKWLMDKAIQVMVDIWNEYVSENDDICYEIDGYTTMYDGDESGFFSTKVPTMKRLKYISLEHDLKAIRDRELDRREVDSKFKSKLSPDTKQEEEPQFTYTEETFKKSAMITDLQLDLVLAKLIVTGWMPKNSSKSNFQKLFSGVPGKFILTWKGPKKALHDFFDMLTKKNVVKNKKLPGYVTPRRDYLTIVRSHFKDENGNWFGELNHERHNDKTKVVIDMLELCLTYSIDECIKMMKTITIDYKTLLDEVDLSIKPEHPSNYGRIRKGVK